MNPCFQRHAEISAHCDRPGTGIDTTLIRDDHTAPLRTFADRRTARLFCGKMFGLFAEKSWQRSAWFSHSDRTCGQKPARCEQLVSNSRISNPSNAVTASSPKSAGTLRRDKVNICVPRHMHFEATSAKQLTASKNDRPAFAVERDYVTNTPHSPAFALASAAIL